LTIGSIILLIAVIACGLAAYREHVKNSSRLVISYPVSDLISSPTASGKQGSSPVVGFGPLIASIKSNVSPWSWKSQGGSGTMTPFFLNQSLIIRTSPRVHKRVEAYLRQMRTARQGGEAGNLTP
jgi:hypothetical protein